MFSVKFRGNPSHTFQNFALTNYSVSGHTELKHYSIVSAHMKVRTNRIKTPCLWFHYVRQRHKNSHCNTE